MTHLPAICFSYSSDFSFNSRCPYLLLFCCFYIILFIINDYCKIFIFTSKVIVHQLEEGTAKGKDCNQVGDGTNAHRYVDRHPQLIHIGNSGKNDSRKQVKPLQDFNGSKEGAGQCFVKTSLI